LSMTRIDIANFLGMAIETISRILKKMRTQQLVKVDGRQITLINIDNLRDCLLNN
jgi:CRP/FNR family transcriptional regulator